MFKEIYGWDPDEFHDDYLNCLFNKLLDVYMKISMDEHRDREIREVFSASFKQNYFQTPGTPIECAIHSLCSNICHNIVMVDGKPRYDLTVEE